jgi:hypothetical protein
MLPNNRRNGGQRDSFSELVGAMKAKKPYMSIASPTLRPELAITSNGKFHYAGHHMVTGECQGWSWPGRL